MQITVMGTGYVGLVTGTCLAELGNDVVCFDIATDKIRSLNHGVVPIYEPGLDDIIARNKAAGRLTFSADAMQAIAHGEIIFIAVGTPALASGGADLSQVLRAAREIGRWMHTDKVVVNKSTVPVGTADRVHAEIQQELDKRGISSGMAFSVVSNPEFLKEGSAVEDFMRPDRLVLGVSDCAQGYRALGLMRNLYAPFNRHHERTLVMSPRAAELTKYAANAMLATRISFMNELANLAEAVSVDIESVRQGIGSDPRIGYSFLYAGAGYGGSCFPKDVQALQYSAMEHGCSMRVLAAVEQVNQLQKHRILDKITRRYGEDLSGRCFAVWGLAFKPETDDMRDAPSRVVIEGLVRLGAKIQAHDPVALQAAQTALQEDLADRPELWGQIIFHQDAYAALEHADALIIMTEWKAFRSPNLGLVKQRLKQATIFDGRNLFDPVFMASQEITYQGIGRLSTQASPSELKPLAELA